MTTTENQSKEPTLRELVSVNIRSIRLKLGLSPESLASKAKISAQYIYSIEKGTRNLSLDSLEAIASALECEACDLICRSERFAQGRKQSLELAIKLLEEQMNKRLD